MIILGILLIVVGLLVKLSILETIGIILIVVGVVYALFAGVGGRYQVGGRRHFF